MIQNYRELPVYRHRGQIIAALQQKQILIVESPTGSGKTTQLPLILHHSGYTEHGVIGITQPRRIATLSVCDFIAQQLGGPADFVAYKMRFEDATSHETRIKLMTDGTLLQELKHDPLLQRYSLLMVDEAHERSLTIDFILGLLKDLLPKRPEFRLLVSSATIRTEAFSQYFGKAPIISIQAESFPVQVIYRPINLPSNLPSNLLPNQEAKNQTRHKNQEKSGKTGHKIPKNVAPDQKSNKEPCKPTNPIEEQAAQICALILQLEAEQQGDVLVFLPGEANIKACLAALLPYEKAYGLYVLPLYARLGKEEQQRIFEAAPFSARHQRPCHKVILATNIAETSLTIDGVTLVIDTGLAKLSHFDSYSQHAELRECSISRASAEQRKGRAGRTAPGRCYRLYSRATYHAMRPYTQEEIQRTDLSEVILRMAELDILNFEEFDFLTKPSRSEIRNAVHNLVQLGAIHPKSHKLTEIGEQMCYFPLLPRHSRILVEAVRIGPQAIHPACVIVAFLSCNSPFLLPHGQEREAREAQRFFTGHYGDFELYLCIFSHYSAIQGEREQFCKRYFLDAHVMYELKRVVDQLKEILQNCPPFAGVPIPETFPEPSLLLQGKRHHKHSKSPIHKTAESSNLASIREDYMRAALAGLQGGLCTIQEGSRSRRKPVYRSLSVRNIIIHPGSSLFGKLPKYVLAAEIVRTSQTYARSASLLEAQWIDNFDPYLRLQLESPQNKKREAKSVPSPKNGKNRWKA